MLIFLRHDFTYLANPKTGTTAVESALKSEAEIIFGKARTHTTARRYIRKVVPFLRDTFGSAPPAVAVMRDPVDQIASWYRFRIGPRLRGTELSTEGLSFDAYIREVALGEDAPPRARIGSQYAFLTGGGQLMVHHLFAYEAQMTFRDWLGARIGKEVQIRPKNVSPEADTGISAQARSQIEAARPDEFALYTRLREAGNQLSQRVEEPTAQIAPHR